MDKRKDDDLERRLLELGTLEELEELVDRIHPEDKKGKSQLRNKISKQYIKYKYSS